MKRIGFGWLAALPLCAMLVAACAPASEPGRNNQAYSGKVSFPVAYKDWNEAAHRRPPAAHAVQVRSLAAQFPGILFFRGNSNRRQVALTFDDGPDNYYTPQILNILRTKGVPATFFVVGKQAQAFPAMLRRIALEGHVIGNHTWDHKKLPNLTMAQVTQEVRSTEAVVRQLTGRTTRLFRPPYGLLTASDIRLIHRLGYRIIDWSVDTTDWRGVNSQTILSLVNRELTPGGIILQHCMAGHPGELNGTVAALPQIIDQLRQRGYEFVTVPMILQP